MKYGTLILTSIGMLMLSLSTYRLFHLLPFSEHTFRFLFIGLSGVLGGIIMRSVSVLRVRGYAFLVLAALSVYSMLASIGLFEAFGTSMTLISMETLLFNVAWLVVVMVFKVRRA